MKNKKTVDFTTGSFLGNIIVFIIPIMFSGLLQLLFNAVDMIVVGQFCGSISLAAVGSTGSLSALIVGLFMGLSSGSGILISRAVGASQKKEIDRILHTSVLSSIAIGVFCFVSAIMEVLVGALLGLGRTLTSTIITILGVCVLRIVWIYTVFARFGTLQALYSSYPVAWISVALANAIMLIIYMKQFKKTLNTAYTE